MANYYHEARQQVKNLKSLETDNKRRAERRAEVANSHAEHPLNLLVIDGRAVKLYKNKELHAATERGDGLISWSVQPDATIDRFDGRALLDIYRDYDPDTVPIKQKTPAEEKLANTLMFESYRDLVRLSARGLNEREGLAAAAAENIEIRAAARAAAMAAYASTGNAPQLMPVTTAAAGQGAYAAVGFSYGGAGAAGGSGAAAAGSSSDSSNDDSDDDEGQDGGGAGPTDAAEAAEEKADELAFARFGIEDFCYRLHKALQEEGEQAERMGRKPRRRHGRKKARERARRMAGQGLNVRDWRDPANAPGAHQRAGRAESKSRSRSRSPGAHGTGAQGPAFALLMRGPQAKGALAHLDKKAFERDDNIIIDALPDLPDPAMVSCQPKLMDLVTLHGIKPQQPQLEQAGGRVAHGGSRSRSRSRERHQDGHWRSRGRSRSSRDRHERDHRGRSRSTSGGRRDRSHSRRDRRSRSRSKKRHRRGGSASRSHSPSRHRGYGRSRSRDRHHSSRRSRSRSRDRHRDRDKDRDRGDDGHRRRNSHDQAGSNSMGIKFVARSTIIPGLDVDDVNAKSSAGGTLNRTAPPTPAVPKPGTGATAGSSKAGSAAGAAAKAETPQERLKRILAVQLNKQTQKDQAVSHLRRIQAEKEKQARASLDMAVLPSRHRSPEH